ncbi:hypothetical protein PGT21_003975 [Puccinia graminis f. sp. tritici]|uniref:Uncharacterized protein n=1 Tax=Puccinia graminis f. sp. tritici TaxID=56615 RepID=A0A5B0QHF7_PUCGR|nr:hypothetical protein PGT21_003975 [Puccinia graminis f. sp. tritici]
MDRSDYILSTRLRDLIPAPGGILLEGLPKQEHRLTGGLPGGYFFLGFGTWAGSWGNFETPYCCKGNQFGNRILLPLRGYPSTPPRAATSSPNLNPRHRISISTASLDRWFIHLEFDSTITSVTTGPWQAPIYVGACQGPVTTRPIPQINLDFDLTTVLHAPLTSSMARWCSFSFRIVIAVVIGLIGQPHSKSIKRYDENPLRYLSSSAFFPSQRLHSISKHPLFHRVVFLSCTSSFTTTTMSPETSNMSSPVEIPAPRSYQAISNPTPVNDVSSGRSFPARGNWSPLLCPTLRL